MMIGVRRYRVFLLVVAFTVISLYYLSTRGSWSASDIESLSHGAFRHEPPKDPAPAPVPAAGDSIKPVDPNKVPIPPPVRASSKQNLEASSTSKDPQATPTITGEELLRQNSGLDNEFNDLGSGRLEIDGAPNDGRKARWHQPPVHFPLPQQEVILLPTSDAKKLPRIQADFAKESAALKKDRVSKLNTVKIAFKHAWTGYKKYGLPHDEVKPISKSHADPFNGWGATLVDSLDTLWIMGLKEDFENATAEVGLIDFRTSIRKDIPLFETVIRYLGGLLAAFDVSDSKYPVLLSKAEELADVLMGAFDTPNRMPVTFYNWAPSYTSQPHRASSHAVMAELGSLSVEMTRLAQLTQKQIYYDAIARITDELEKWQQDTLMPGLWPLKLDASGCKKAERPTQDDVDVVSGPILLDSGPFDINKEKPNSVSGDNADEFKASPADKKKRSPDPRVPVFVDTPGRFDKLNANRTSNGQPNDSTHWVATKEDEFGRPIFHEVEQDVLQVECIPQGLAPEPHAKTQTFGIGGQADSTYEYFPKMHVLLQGRTSQYEKMYRLSVKTIREKLLFRPMTQDKNVEILFAAKYELNPKAKTAEKKENIVHEVTHLSCFAGGMFAYGSKIFGIEDDMDLARQLTDGCVWAYGSMPTGVMAETAAVVPCPSLEVCSWNQTRWHEALDPHLNERVAAVEAWNRNQQAAYEKSKKVAIKEAAVDDEGNSGPKQTGESSKTSDFKIEKRANSPMEHSKSSPELDSPMEASKTSPEPEFAIEEDEAASDADSIPIKFVPKSALSHKKFVKARIQEERLPPSYTKIFDRHYGLRPEAIESIFYMYRLTGDEKWRDKGWKMFEAVQSATQTEVANAAMKDVTSNLGELDDKMESYWLAETLKYFYLLFDDPKNWSLDEWVLNTEAHFLRIPK